MVGDAGADPVVIGELVHRAARGERVVQCAGRRVGTRTSAAAAATRRRRRGRAARRGGAASARPRPPARARGGRARRRRAAPPTSASERGARAHEVRRDVVGRVFAPDVGGVQWIEKSAWLFAGA